MTHIPSDPSAMNIPATAQHVQVKALHMAPGAPSPVSVPSSRMPTGKSPMDKAAGHEVIWPNVAPLFEAARGIRDICFVYVIGEPDDGHLKIGSSKNPIGRLRTMQTGNPRRLRVEHVLLGHADLERLLHEMWEPFAVRSADKRRTTPGTEWFTPAVRPDLTRAIALAAQRQVEYLTASTSDSGAVDSGHLAWLVRQAHADLDINVHKRDVPKHLARGAGYSTSRTTRV